MTKRKVDDDPHQFAIPLPIQTFLWRQTSPFIRPKLGKLHEATCVFCQQAPGHHEMKEACKSFEKVLVQNIQFGLSPSLTEAIRSIPRWRLVEAALPHVMHCCASMLYNRRDNIGRLGSGETKLLYTLHWILLDAAEECADADPDRLKCRRSSFFYLFSLTAIEVFVYLFAPLCFYLKESDFQSFRLENGLKIWQSMWDYRHPDVFCFTAHVKPRRTVLQGNRLDKTNAQFGDVFLGGGKGDKMKGDDTSSLGFLCLDSPPVGVSSLEVPSGSGRDDFLSDGAFTFDVPEKSRTNELSRSYTQKQKVEEKLSGQSLGTESKGSSSSGMTCDMYSAPPIHPLKVTRRVS